MEYEAFAQISLMASFYEVGRPLRHPQHACVDVRGNCYVSDMNSMGVIMWIGPLGNQMGT